MNFYQGVSTLKNGKTDKEKMHDQRLPAHMTIHENIENFKIVEQVKKFDCKKSIFIAFLDELGGSFFKLRD